MLIWTSILKFASDSFAEVSFKSNAGYLNSHGFIETTVCFEHNCSEWTHLWRIWCTGLLSSFILRISHEIACYWKDWVCCWFEKVYDLTALSNEMTWSSTYDILPWKWYAAYWDWKRECVSWSRCIKTCFRRYLLTPCNLTGQIQDMSGEWVFNTLSYSQALRNWRL